MKYVQAHLRSPAAPRPARAALLALVALGLAACGSVDLVATTNIPEPLVTKVPVTVALYVPKEFADYVHKEERWSTDWNVALGAAQAEGIERLMNAMFERVVIVDSVNAGAQLDGVRAIFEPSVEEYAFVTPRDAGTPIFAVSIKYRVNIYSPDGRLADSWGFTGYGTSPSQGLSSSAPLAHATSLALRDAGAKLAVEFREQAIVRGLIPEADQATAPVSAPALAPPTSGSSTPLQSAPPAEPPSSSEPASSEPASSEPASSEPAPSSEPEPSSEPATSEPAPSSEPAPGEAPVTPESSPPADPPAPEPSSEPESGPSKSSVPSLALTRHRARVSA